MRKEHSLDLKQRVVTAHQNGKSYGEISKLLILPKSTVRNIITRWKQRGTVMNKPRSGAPKKISLRSSSLMKRLVTSNPKITRKELADNLKITGTSVSLRTITSTLRKEGINKRRPRRVPLLKKIHLSARIQYAKNLLNKENEFINNICGRTNQKYNFSD
ncbi:uncharacterized protein LOC115228528 [Octopus sinensis]|uniref:Uncharacterized protein LOC115228528 n=1 Tax=Octopus sinensis TaxID=2607531 RepID=A0A6P7TT79_9MOLL|nr:uncharacterized protein LOC115228528 [Octopus sinensis]